MSLLCNDLTSSLSPQIPCEEGEDLVIKVEKIYTTLLRDNTGLGFSIAGGLGAAPYKEGSDSLFVSKITEQGAAQKDGKLTVGDKIVQINGVDVTDARHDQVSQPGLFLVNYLAIHLMHSSLAESICLSWVEII